MYSPRLYKYRDSYELYIPTTHAFGSLLLIHTLLVQTWRFRPLIPDQFHNTVKTVNDRRRRSKSLGRLCEYISSSLDFVFKYEKSKPIRFRVSCGGKGKSFREIHIFRKKKNISPKISQNKIQKKIINYNKIKFLMLSSQNTTSTCFAINCSSFNSFECFFAKYERKFSNFFAEVFVPWNP